MDVMYTQGKGVYYRNKGGERVFTHPPTAEISTFLLFFFFVPKMCPCGRPHAGGIHRKCQVQV